MPAKDRVTVNLDPSRYQELCALAEKHDVSFAWIGRRAIEEFLDRYSNEELQLSLGPFKKQADQK